MTNKPQDTKENKGRPLVKWVGGKSQLLNQLESNFPKKFNTYFEPFFGGGAVFFMLSPEKAYINDINETLVQTYATIKSNPRKVISSLKKLQKEYDSRNQEDRKILFLEIRQKYNALPLGSTQRVPYLIFLNKTCYNGLYRENSKGGFNVPFGNYLKPKIVDEENLLTISKLLEHTTITNTDFKNAVRNAKKGDFIYFDPPYYPLNVTSNFTDYSGNGFTAIDQERLRDVFIELDKKGCFIMLSNSNTDFIRKLYKGYKIKEVNARRAINCKGYGRGEIKELLILNY